MNPRMPWTELMFRVLADGAWHPREVVLFQMMPLVPHGRAFRKRQWIVTHLRTHRGWRGTATERTDEQIVAIGRRHIAMDSIRLAFEHGRIEQRHLDGRGVEIRLSPKLIATRRNGDVGEA